MAEVIRIHKDDNVAVAAEVVKKGDRVRSGDGYSGGA